MDYLAATSLSLMKLMPKIVVASTKTAALSLQSMEQEGIESLARHTSRGGIGDYRNNSKATSNGPVFRMGQPQVV